MGICVVLYNYLFDPMIIHVYSSNLKITLHWLSSKDFSKIWILMCLTRLSVYSNGNKNVIFVLWAETKYKFNI